MSLTRRQRGAHEKFVDSTNPNIDEEKGVIYNSIWHNKYPLPRERCTQPQAQNTLRLSAEFYVKKGSAQRINVVVIRKIMSISVVDDRLKADCIPRVVLRIKLTVNTVLRGTWFGESEF